MRRKLAASVVSIASVALVTASCQAGSVAKAPDSTRTAAAQETGAPTAATPPRCGAERRFLPAQSQLPGFTQYVQYPHMLWPGTSLAGHPNSFQVQYVCGEFYGFIANIALSGYAPGKWPLTPLTGSIVRQNKHGVLEIYATLFEFKSAHVAAQYIDAQKPVKVLAGLALQYDDRQIPVNPRPGSLVTTEYEGADVSSDESQITIRVPIGDYVVILDLQGGTDLDWNDVLPYWIKTNSLLEPLQSGRNR